MNKINSVLLSSTLHDPELKFIDLMKSVLPLMETLFKERIVCCTPSTQEKVINFLRAKDFKIIIGNSMDQVGNYKLSIQASLKYIANPKTQKILYIDFDRLLHWLNNYPNELSNAISTNTNFDYVHIGRTSRAFETHPPTQKETEGIINEIASKILGFPKKKDIISVCFLISKELGNRIIKLKNVTTTGFYSSWPIIFWSIAETKKYIEVEGLEWETPDQFKDEIKELGYEIWLEKFQSAKEWRKRVKLLHEGLLEIYQLADIKFRKKI
ncbi:MAG: hypothetical protein ACFFHV_13960 [Promethearchaeota archaeon]